MLAVTEGKGSGGRALRSRVQATRLARTLLGTGQRTCGRREWAQVSGCFLVSNVMTRSLAPIPAGDRSGVGTTRDILKQMSSTPLTFLSAMTLPKFPCDHTPWSSTAYGRCALP